MHWLHSDCGINLQPLYRGEYQRLLLNLCPDRETRKSLVQIFMGMLVLDLGGPVGSKVNSSELPYWLYGCQSYIVYSRSQFSDENLLLPGWTFNNF